MAVKRVPTKERVIKDLINDHASEINKLIADIATLRTAFNTAITKLNADAGVTDADYAQCAALTSAGAAADTVA
jgi:hypothetical protein